MKENTMSQFNPDLFMQTSSTESLSTKLIPVPEGEFPGVIKSVTPRTLPSGSAVVDVVWGIDSPEVASVTGIANPTVRQSLWLDLTESGGLDFSKGKNVQLGRLREAVGQNKAGKAWAPSMLMGAAAKIKVTQSPDKNDPDTIYANVSAVSAL